MRKGGNKISLLNVKTLLPIGDTIYKIMEGYQQVYIAEENLNGQYRQLVFGAKSPDHVFGINKIGKMITPKEIIEEIVQDGK